MNTVKRYVSAWFLRVVAPGALVLGLASSGCVGLEGEADDVAIDFEGDAYAPTDWPVDGSNGNDLIYGSDLDALHLSNHPPVVNGVPDPWLLSELQGPTALAYDFMINSPTSASYNDGVNTYQGQNLCPAMTYPPSLALRKSRAANLLALTNPSTTSVPISLIDPVCSPGNGPTNYGYTWSNPSLPAGTLVHASQLRHSGRPDARLEVAIYNASQVFQSSEDGTWYSDHQIYHVWVYFPFVQWYVGFPADHLIRKRLCGDLHACSDVVIYLHDMNEASTPCAVETSGTTHAVSDGVRNVVTGGGVKCKAPTLNGGNYIDTVATMVDWSSFADVWGHP